MQSKQSTRQALPCICQLPARVDGLSDGRIHSCVLCIPVILFSKFNEISLGHYDSDNKKFENENKPRQYAIFWITKLKSACKLLQQAKDWISDIANCKRTDRQFEAEDFVMLNTKTYKLKKNIPRWKAVAEVLWTGLAYPNAYAFLPTNSFCHPHAKSTQLCMFAKCGSTHSVLINCNTLRLNS